MFKSTRRTVIGLGLVAGTTALGSVLHPASAADTAAPTLAGLRFRLATDYTPDVSTKAQQRLTRAIVDFLLATHPPGTTLSIWDQNPQDMPFLDGHVRQIVAAVAKGVKDNLPVQAVDPVLIIALLYNESRFSPVVISPAGALGIAQFMPDTALEYGLEPIARLDLWERYRALQKIAREQRAESRQRFLQEYSLTEFSADAVIQRTLATQDLSVLTAYQQLANAEQPDTLALQEYIATVRTDLAALNFFTGDASRIRELDGRTDYAAATKAVDYIARRLKENSGMTSSAIAAYNAGPAAVSEANPRSVLYSYGTLPAYAETVKYLQRIIVVYTRLQELLEAPA